MADDIIDYSGNDNNEFNFLEPIDVPDTFVDENFDELANAIIYNVNLADSFQKKVDSLVEQTSTALYKEGINMQSEILQLIKQKISASRSIDKLIMGVHSYTNKKDIYWHNCSFEVYESHIELFKDLYILELPDSKAIDFYKNEFLYFIDDSKFKVNLTRNTTDILSVVNYEKHLLPETLEYLKIQKQRKIDYLVDRINLFGYQILTTKKDKIIFVSNISPEEKKIETEEETVDTTINLANLPNFNLEHRYEIVKELGIEKLLMAIDAPKKSKDMLLALLMSVSVDNAKKLLNNDYKKNSDPEINKIKTVEITREIDDFFERNKIKLKK